VNQRPRQRLLGSEILEAVEIPWRGRIIWGATCGMLMTLQALLNARRAQPA